MEVLLLLIGCSSKEKVAKEDDVSTVEKLSLIEETIQIGERYLLERRITNAQNINKKVPTIILVHGSGPCDMDMTIGKTKVFQDMAYGLAKQGIVVLRYDKRTYTYGQEIAQDETYHFFIYQEETIDDVIDAKEEVL